MPVKKRYWEKVATSVLQTFVFALCLEIAARADDQVTFGAPFWKRYTPDLLRTKDNDGIPRNVPGAQFEKWKVNSLGFRGKETTRDKPPGIVRLVCLGQSETFGLYEQEGGEWPAQLGQLAKSKYPYLEVVNASVVGTSRTSRIAYLKKYILPIKPDIVVLYINALNDGLSDEEPLIPQSPDEPAPVSLTEYVRLLPKLKRSIHSAIPNNVDEMFRAWFLDRQLERIEQRVRQGQAARDTLATENVVRFTNHLVDLVRLLKESHVAPMLATYPTLLSEHNLKRYHHQIALSRQYYPRYSERGLLDAVVKVNDATRQLAKGSALPLVDVDASIDKSAVNFADTVHYTSAGAVFVAARVLATAEKSRLLRSEPY